ncbi:MAG: hypothetical protein ACREOV_14640 [Candidatus Dormibacteraceae bacterium]
MDLPGSRHRRRRRALERALATPSTRSLVAAAGLGASAGLRTGTPLAVLQLRGRLLPWPQGWWIMGGAAGELIVDKLPVAGKRTSPVGLLGRMASAAWAGAVVAGPYGAGVAAATAVGSAFAGMQARALLIRRTGLPDGVFGTAEDLVAAALATGATSLR